MVSLIFKVTLFSEPMCGAIAAMAEKSNHSYIPIDGKLFWGRSVAVQ